MEWLKIVIPIVPLVLKPLKAIMKHVAYPFKVSSNISSLESATTELRAAKEDVQTTITNAERKNGEPTEQVKLWLRKAEGIEKKSEEIQQNYQQLGWCLWNISPNLWSNYKISRSAAKKQLEVKGMCDKRSSIDVIIEKPSNLAQEMPASSSKSSNLELALEYIKNDEWNIIGIWGMGGVGKTHLLKQINNELSKDNTFKVVIFVTCSKECFGYKVQNEIINKLDLQQKKDSTEQNQSTIYNFLSGRSFVLLLDDLWNRVDLDTIGIPNLSDKRKVVLTTRSTEVCGQMEARKKIKVDVLNEDDAWSLFREKATEDTINSNPIIQKYAEEVVKELGRLPLALITVGRAMNDKMDPKEWEEALELLKQARLNDVEFPDSSHSVFHTLKFSYDNLKNDTLKQCFLHCSLWPEDWGIEKKNLVEVWMGLGLIDESEIHKAYNIGYNHIRRLQAVCLLEETDRDYLIKMHDVIRDMALWIANDQGVDRYKWIVQAGTYLEGQVIKLSQETEKLSLMQNNTEKFSFFESCSSTKVSTLLLGGNRMKDAKSLPLELFSDLTVLDLSNNNLETFPIEICTLVHLQYLDLSGYSNPRIESLPREFEVFTELKYLFLREECTIPKGVLSKLKALRVLAQSKIFSSLEEELRCLPEFQAVGISIDNFIDFKELSQTSMPIRWLTIKRLASAIEDLSFTSCFLGNSQLQSNLIQLKIELTLCPTWVTFERATDDHTICSLGRLEELLFLGMSGMEKVVWKGLNPKDVFPILQALSFQHCFSLKSISWIVCLPCIRELHVTYCTGTKQLIHIGELSNDGIMISQPSFPFLKKMILENNSELESIADHPMITFPVLECLYVYRCNKLKKLPFKTGKPPKELSLGGTKEWWNNIEMEDSSHRSLLQSFFKETEW